MIQEVPTYDNMGIYKADRHFELVILFDYYAVPPQTPVKINYREENQFCLML